MGHARNTRLAACTACFAASSMLAAGAAQAQAIAFTTEYVFPDSILVDGKLTGFVTEKVREMMRRAAMPYSIKMLPWNRAYTLAQTDANTCVYSASRTPERESLFQWVGPVGSSDWTLFGRADRSYSIKTIEDARGLRIGGYNGDVRGTYLANRGYRVEFVANDTSNPKKLLLDRIDLWVGSPLAVQAVLAGQGIGDKVVPVLTFHNVKFYIACNRGLPAAQVGQMSEALREMDADGTSRAIEQKYEHRPAPAVREKP
jgi:polar amino acid transport system substrate-binding protein